MTRVFLTGATGFLGKHLVKALCAADCELLALVRSPSSTLANWRHNVQTVYLPDAGLHTLADVLSGGFEVVYHLAAFIPPAHNDPSFAGQCLETNVMLTSRLLQASVQSGVRRFVYFSAGNAYAQDSDAPATEADPLYPSGKSPFYLGSKLLGEILVEHFGQAYGIETIALRIASPYGIGMSPQSAFMRFVQRAREHQPLQVHAPAYKADWVYVDDVVTAAVAALRRGPPGIYNVGSGVSASLLELAQTVLKVFERNALIEIAPTDPCATKGFRPINIGKIQMAWGWNPRRLNEGLRAMRVEMERAENG